MTERYIVWNGDKTEGYATNDLALALNVVNLNINNETAHNAKEFCASWYDDNLTIEVVND